LRNNAAVSALVSGRVYALIVPQDQSRPAIAFQRISGPRTYAHTGKTIGFARFQLTCEGNSYSEASQVVASARRALEAAGWRCVNEQDGFSTTVEAPVKRVDFTKYYQEDA